MIRHSALAAAACLVASLVAHIFGVGVTIHVPSEPGQQGPPVDTVALGNSFEDLADTLSQPVEPDPPVEMPPEPEPAAPPTSHALVASPNPEATLSPGTGQADAVQAEAVEPVTPDPAGSRGDVAQAASPSDVTPDETSQAAEGSQLAPVAPVTRAPLLAATPSPSPRLEANERVAAAPVSPVPVPPVNLSPGPAAIPIAPSEPDVAEIEAPADAPEIAPEQAEDGSSGPDGSILAVRSSPRPPARSTRRSAAASEATGDGPPPLLLSESPLTAYARDGSLGGWTGRRGTGGSGNAAVGNYAGRVLVHLNNTPPVGATARGSARVVFVINPDGTLASVDVVQSTGTFELDNAAKSQVRRAAPFPVPPGGTSRRLSFIYRSR